MATSCIEQTKLSYEIGLTTDGTQSKKLIVPQYSEKKLKELLAETIIMNEMLFLIVEEK